MKEKLTFGKGIIVGAVSVVILLFLFFGIYFVTQKIGEDKAYHITTTPMTDILPQKPMEEKKPAETAEDLEEENEENTENNIEEEVSQSFTLTLVQENSWGDDTDKKYVQWKGTLINNSTETVYDWKVNIKLPMEAKIDQFWNFTGILKEGNYTITPASYNQSVEATQSIEFGFILINGGDITAQDYQVYADNQKKVSETLPLSQDD